MTGEGYAFLIHEDNDKIYSESTNRNRYVRNVFFLFFMASSPKMSR